DYRDFKALRSDESGDYLYHTFVGSMLGAFILAGPDAGAIEISVDGNDWKSVELHHRYSKSLNYPRSVVLADDLGGGYHTVAIRTAPGATEGAGATSTFLYFVTKP
ncbi:MAG: SGNH/GDSL hydrolase family protein, partial [Verrucomicrobiota bacterium]